MEYCMPQPTQDAYLLLTDYNSMDLVNIAIRT